MTINYQSGFAAVPAHGKQQLSGYITPAIAEAPLVGPVPQSAPLVLAISLPVQVPMSFPALADFAQQVSDPKNARYRQFLTPAQYASYYQPSTASYNALKVFVQSYGLTVARTTPDNEIIDLTGTAGQVEQMISANLNLYARPDGSQFFAPDREPSLALSTPVLSVAGIKNYSVPIPSGSGAGTGPTKGDLWGKDFRNAYVASCQGQFDGAGQTIGIVATQTFNATDIAAYAKAAGISDPTSLITTVTYSAPFAGSPSSNQNEAPLDIELAHAMAPGAKIVVYLAPSSYVSYGPFGAISFIDDILHDMAHPPAGVPRPNQNSNSYVGQDVDDDTTQNLASLASLGESFFTVSGDGGAFTGDSLDVRSLGNVTIVGGTNVVSFGGGKPPVEQGWTGSGGGFFGPTFTLKSGAPGPSVPLPSYQSSFVTNGASSTYRNFPDVAMPAQNIADFYTLAGSTTATDNPTGGTSAASPMWAGFMALANEAAQSSGVQTVGFANPLLYAMAGNASLYSTCFNDIASTGRNPPNSTQPGAGQQDPSSPAPSAGFSVGAGYDLVTGLGSPTCTLIAQLASPTPLVPVPPPPPPPPNPTPSEVFAGIGPNDTCGMVSGAVECWGNNGAGQDGNGTTNQKLTPGCVTSLTGVIPAVQVVQGSSHSCVLFSDGGVWCWGDNAVGQFGNPTPSSSSTPIVAQSLDAVDMGNPPTQISAGGNTTCALLSDGAVWCWGSNSQGQLGNGSANSAANPPTLVTPLPPASQVAVSTGGAFVCALLVNGGVDCWGSGYLGDFNLDMNSPPVSAQGLTNATAIALGRGHACAIVTQSARTPSNVLYCWGDNSESEIGEGDVNTGAFPVHVTVPVVATQVSGCTTGCPPAVNVTAVALGDNYTCVVVTGGHVECWGDDAFGQLGNGVISGTPNSNPQTVSGLTGVTQLAAGPGRTCALAGGISCWGEGLVGDGSTGAQSTPKGVTFARCP